MPVEVSALASGSTAKLADIKDHIDGILMELEAMPAIPTDALSYSELKMQLMINYIANLSFYLSLKVKGESVANHPVFKHLAYLRTFMERLAPLDASLKYHIDKLLLEDTKQAVAAEEAAEAASGPNLAAFVPSVTSAVKNISLDQVKRSSNIDMSIVHAAGGRLEIDPSLIAAQIEKAQAKAAAAPKRKTETYVEEGSMDEGMSDDFDKVPKKKTSKSKKKQVVKDDEDDEEIDSDFEL